jgi:hypothetical protein
MTYDAAMTRPSRNTLIANPLPQLHTSLPLLQRVATARHRWQGSARR